MTKRAIFRGGKNNPQRTIYPASGKMAKRAMSSEMGKMNTELDFGSRLSIKIHSSSVFEEMEVQYSFTTKKYEEMT